MGIEEFKSGSSPEPTSPSGSTAVVGGMTDAREKFFTKGIDGFLRTGRIREKLKTANVKKDEDVKRGPVIVKHPSASQLNVEVTTHAGPLGATANEPSKTTVKSYCQRGSRTPSPRALKSDSLLSDGKVSLRRSHSIVSPQRRRSPSTPRSRPSSPSSVCSFKGPSPAGSLDNLYVETVLKRVQKAQKARLYLLQQPGPHSFVIGGDSPEHKFRIIIGPQTCTCGRGPHCIHLLFVMLRVFQIPENDPRMWSKQLKNFEVETLFAQYEKQRQSRIKTVKEKSKCSKLLSTPLASTATLEPEVNEIQSSRSTLVSSNQDEGGELCPICLLDMVDGESLVTCLAGCRNKLHHHCISIWAEECRRQHEPFLCPLCRTPWQLTVEQPERSGDVGVSPTNAEADSTVLNLQDLSRPPLNQGSTQSVTSNQQSVSQPSSPKSIPKFLISSSRSWTPTVNEVTHHGGHRTRDEFRGSHDDQPSLCQHGSSTVIPGFSLMRCTGFLKSGLHVPLPRCHSVIPKEHSKKAAIWSEVFGGDLVNCLYSRDWRMRETALRWLSQEMLEEMVYQNGLNGFVSSGQCYSRREDMIQCCCQMLALVAADPVYRVYLACLQCLRTLLAYVPIKTEAHLIALQDLIRPIVSTILLRCCDGTKRASQLSIATLVELCKGQKGELAVGHRTSYPGDVGVGGVNYILKCIFEMSGGKESHSWQWVLGRLNVLEQLMDEFPEEFHLVLVPSTASNAKDSVDFSESPIASRQERLMTLLRFILNALEIPHATVGKRAREVFMIAASFAITVKETLHQICALASKDPFLQVRFGAWMREEVEEFLERETRPTALFHSVAQPGSCWPNSRMQFPLPHSIYSPNTHHHHHSHHQNSTYKMVAVHPHLPSCGGISPTKGLDRSYLEEKLSNVNSFGLSKRRFSGGRYHSSKSVSPSSVPWIPPFSIWNEPHSKNSTKSYDSPGAGQKRPNYLPLIGSFKDVLEWERFAGTMSPSPSSGTNPQPHSARYRSPTRFDKKSKGPWDSGCSMQVLGSQTSSSRVPAQMRDSRNLIPSTPKKASSVNNSCKSTYACTCGREIALPVLKSLRKQAESRPNGRFGSTKLACHLGPVLPSFPNLDYSQRGGKRESPNSALPPMPPSLLEKGDSSVNISGSKSAYKEDLEEMTDFIETIVQSPQSNDLIRIPGLMRYNDEQDLIIHVEPDDVDCDEVNDRIQSPSYIENVHWKKGSVLGNGAFSTCYQALDLQTGTLMAVKQVPFSRITPEDQEKVMANIKEEIALMAQLDHPNIVRILGVTQQQKSFNMFVEWMPGGSVSSLLDKYGPFSETVIINYTQQVLAGLAYLHDHQVLHRDLKGANLLVDSTGHYLRIGDFGAAARLASRATVTGEFQGQLLGTIAFMAPEVLRGDDYGRSCDIWSVGCAVIEMATTKPPWNANDVSNHLALIYKIARAQESPPIPEHLSSATRDLALRCLEVNSEDRPPAKDLLKHPVFQMQVY